MGACGTEHGLISVDEAFARILQQVKVLPQQWIALTDALGCVLAEDLLATVNLPLFAQSAVDGYALNMTDSQRNIFQVVGEIRAGQDHELHLQPDQAVRIFTGAAIPPGTTTVARQEIVTVLEKQQIQLRETLQPHADIRDEGEELRQGERIASAGQLLTVGAIAYLSMAGVSEVKVCRQPKIAVVVTGDEVSSASEQRAPGHVFDANTPMLKAWFQQRRLAADFFLVEDEYAELQARFEQLQQHYDLICTTGGVSVGDYDFVRPVALQCGFQQVFWKVRQKPGKPLFFANFQRTDRSYCYLLGLPGNPAAVFIGMQLYTTLILQALQQAEVKPPQWFSAILQHDLRPDARERFLRMHCSWQAGELHVSALSKQQSHMLSNLMYSDCIVRIPAQHAAQAGDVVQGQFIT